MRPYYFDKRGDHPTNALVVDRRDFVALIAEGAPADLLDPLAWDYDRHWLADEGYLTPEWWCCPWLMVARFG